MKTLLLSCLTLFILQYNFAQDVLTVSGNGKLIAEFNSSGESPNVKGVYLEKYQTLVSLIEGTNVVKCMVRIGGTVNVIGQWEMNDLNEVQIKVYEVELEKGKTDILMLGFTDLKALQINVFRLHGEDLVDLGYNYIEQQYSGKSMKLTIDAGKVEVIYDEGKETPKYAIMNGEFRELSSVRLIIIRVFGSHFYILFNFVHDSTRSSPQ